jgi:hypothetical protein
MKKKFRAKAQRQKESTQRASGIHSFAAFLSSLRLCVKLSKIKDSSTLISPLKLT